MNWYKRAQFNDEPPAWDFPEADHDYNPNWDYEVVIPDEKLIAISEKIMNEINTKYMPQIGMGKAKASYIKGKPGALAFYINGTAPYPVFVIDLENIRTSSEECAMENDFDCEKEIYIGISTTLFHELGHAIQDWMNLYPDEDQAEEFWIHLHEYGEVWNFWE